MAAREQTAREAGELLRAGPPLPLLEKVDGVMVQACEDHCSLPITVDHGSSKAAARDRIVFRENRTQHQLLSYDL